MIRKCVSQLIRFWSILFSLGQAPTKTFKGLYLIGCNRQTQSMECHSCQFWDPNISQISLSNRSFRLLSMTKRELLPKLSVGQNRVILSSRHQHSILRFQVHKDLRIQALYLPSKILYISQMLFNLKNRNVEQLRSLTSKSTREKSPSESN